MERLTSPVFFEQLHNKRKSCILQWIPAHVNIEGNECADSLAKEARDIEHKCTTITLDDANAVAKHRIMNHTFKKPLVTEFDCPRIITSTIARLRTEHLKGMKIHPDKTRSYVQCKHCPDLQLTPNHILECPTVATKLLKMGMVPLRDSFGNLSPDFQDFRRNLVISTAFIHGHENNNNIYSFPCVLYVIHVNKLGIHYSGNEILLF
ncbi:RNase H domain-containing protein [Trichonephila clavipes]|nr:RNase H domain-containing protein [Trichonephila clavipes]